MRVTLGIMLTLVLATLGVGRPSAAQETLTRRDGQGPVTVALTLVAPPAVGAPLRVKMVLDTHSVALDGVAFEQAVTLRTSDGTEIAPATVEQGTGGGHHREAVLVFPALTQGKPLRIVVRNVGGVAERNFVWE